MKDKDENEGARLIDMTHATLDQKITINPLTVFYTYDSEASKCCHIVSTGGAVVPVVEKKVNVDATVAREVNRALMQTITKKRKKDKKK